MPDAKPESDSPPQISIHAFANCILIDAPIARFRFLKMMVGAFLTATLTQAATFGLAFFSMMYFSLALSIPTIIGCMCAQFLWFFLSARRDIRRLRRALAETASQPIEQVIDRIAPRRKAVRNPPQIRSLVHEMARTGRRGISLRFAPPAQLHPIDPLNVPIEPMVIDERDANFKALAGDDATPITTAAEPRPTGDTFASSRYRRLLQRGSLLGVVILIIILGATAVDLIRTGMAWLGIILLLICFMIGCTIPFGAIVIAGPRPWLIVNGGLLIRRRRGLRYYRAAECVLEIEVVSPSHAFLSVSDGKAWDVRPTTPAEWQTTLRAWLSPLPPPDLAKLSDLQ